MTHLNMEVSRNNGKITKMHENQVGNTPYEIPEINVQPNHILTGASWACFSWTPWPCGAESKGIKSKDDREPALWVHPWIYAQWLWSTVTVSQLPYYSATRSLTVWVNCLQRGGVIKKNRFPVIFRLNSFWFVPVWGRVMRKSCSRCSS